MSQQPGLAYRIQIPTQTHQVSNQMNMNMNINPKPMPTHFISSDQIRFNPQPSKPENEKDSFLPNTFFHWPLIF